MSFHRTLPACALLVATLAACADSPTGGGGDTQVQLRFGVAGSQALASSASFQTSGTEQLVVAGANGTLRIDDLRLVVADFELDGDDDVNGCSDDTPATDDCEDFDVGPMFIDLPLAGGPIAVATGDIPPGVYDELEFEAEDLDDDEEEPAERARIEALRQQILAQFPDWPREASMLVVGTFTPTGGTARPFRVFVEAEIEIETELSPPLVVGQGESRSVDVLLDPAAIFRSGGDVVDLSSGGEHELELEIRDGFSGHGSGNSGRGGGDD
jgi:hypothetical protein